MNAKKYFQDRTILFLHIAIIAIASLNVIMSYARIDTSKSVAIIRYQVAGGLDGFSRADTYELYSFMAVTILLTAVAFFLGARLYKQKRFMSVLLLSLTLVVLIFNFVVSNAVFNLQ